MKYEYPCTRHIELDGFGSFLERETTQSRININKFGEKLKKRFRFPYVTLVNSGSSANLVAALALAEKTKEKGMPLTAAISAFTFPTTISALVLAGFDLMIVDVDENSFNISYNKLKELKYVPSVIAVTHFLGFPCDIENISNLAKEHNSLVLQDACETLGMQVNGKDVFSYGDITTLSFYHPHHLSSYGGGAVITLDQDDYVLVDSIAHWGRACKCHIDESLCKVHNGPAHQFTYERLGLNVEISELNACFGRWQLQNWDKMEHRRLLTYDLLYQNLKNSKHIKVWEMPNIASSPFVFPIKLTNGMTVNDAYDILSKLGIEIRTLMGGVSNEQEAFFDILDDTLQVNAHRMAKTTFFVGIHQTLNDGDISFISKKLKEIFG